MAPDPSAEPTVLIEAEAPPAPAPPAAMPEPEPSLPPPWWKTRLAVSGAASAVVLLGVGITVASWPAPEPLEPPRVIVPGKAPSPPPAPAPAPVAAPAPVVKPRPKPTARPPERADGFVAWPGDRKQRTAKPAPHGEPLKRPSF